MYVLEIQTSHVMRLWYFSSSVNACMVTHSLNLHTQPSDGAILFDCFVYFHTLCMRTAKALAWLRGCAGSPEPSLVAYVISTIIS